MKFLHSADWQLGKPFGRFEPVQDPAISPPKDVDTTVDVQ